MKFEDVKKIVIAGAGTMGYSAAQVFAEHGYDITLYNHRLPTLEKAKERIRLNQQNLVDTGKRTQEEMEEILSNITYTTDISCMEYADLVNESIVENLEIKKEFWTKASALAKPDAILTTDTSGTPISKIAEAVVRPERFCGMHWVNPTHLIPLLEIIEGNETAEETALVVKAVGEAVGKVPVIARKDVPGFIINRMQFAMARECMHLVKEGIASAEDVDKTMKYGLGVRWAFMGPFLTQDFGGLDIHYGVSCYLFQDLSKMDYPIDEMKELVEAGHLGIKTQKGWFDYPDGKDVEMIKYRDECLIRHCDMLLEMDKKYGLR